MLKNEEKKANIECMEAKKKEMTKENKLDIACLNGRVKAFLDALNWITEREIEEEKEKIHAKGERTG